MEDLGKLGDNELISEIKKLKTEACRRKNNDHWYYMIGDEGYESDVTFNIAHKRHWHLHHTTEDRGISGLVKLPKGFDEIGESNFEYKGSTEEAERLLALSGLTKLENPFWWQQALSVYVPINRVGWPRLDFKSDTPQIKELVTNFIVQGLPLRSDNLPTDWSRDSYLARIEEFARNHGLVHVVTSDYQVHDGRWEGAGISLLSKDVFDSLPQFPKRYFS